MRNYMTRRIATTDLERVLGGKLSESISNYISKPNLYYRGLLSIERDRYLNDVIGYLMSDDIVTAGKHRADDWEKGWSENLELFKISKDISDLTPKYHGKYNIVRWNGDVVMSLVPDLDYRIHKAVLDWVIETYLSNVDNIFEIGCGACDNLFRVRAINKNAKLTGMDWSVASQNIITEINKQLGYDWTGLNFDLYKPNNDIEVPDSSAFLTVAALEQIGTDFKPFVDFVLFKKPDICVHIEPIEELLDKESLIDNLSLLYFKKRRYLSGYLTYLRWLEKEGKIEILRELRTFTGSYFIEGHSLVVWKPC
jgi:hypothetical protein